MAPRSGGQRPNDQPGLATSTATATSSTSSLDPFPPLSASQRSRIEHTLNRLPQGARTWADLTRAQAAAEGSGPDKPDVEDNDDEGMYEVWLRLVWQDGVTWRDKWDNAKRQLDQGPGAAAPRRNHRRRPSDNLDLLRAKLDRVALENQTARGARGAQAPAAGRGQESAPAPSRPPQRPHSTPPRPLLVRPSHDSSVHPDAFNHPRKADDSSPSDDDDFVGVPTPRRRRRSTLPPRAEGRRRAVTTDEEGHTPRAHVVRPRERRAPPRPAMTSTPVRGGTAVAAADPTPLLSARLSALPVPHDSDHLYHSHRLHEHYHENFQSGLEPDSDVRHDPNHRPPASPTLSSSSMLISSALSQPEALSRAIQFSRLRLLLPLFSHWSARTAAIRAREEDLVAKRGDWLRRCALEQWHGRRARIWEKKEEATRWCAGKTQRRAIAAWRDKVAERARRHRVDGLTGARDRVVARRNARILETAVRAWRLAAAERVVQRRRAGRIALGALTAWAERSRSRAERERSLEQLAEERFDRSELRRAKIAWKWWISRTALRVKEDAIRTEKNRQVVEGAWEAWRNKACVLSLPFRGLILER